jgi:hypothetical protein
MAVIRFILIKFADKNQNKDEKYQIITHVSSEYHDVWRQCPDVI